jgi:hypothetical protein
MNTINDSNYQLANKAMSSILLLYYHLLKEGGFSADQNVYIDPSDFDPYFFININVDENFRNDIDENFLREGAIVYLVCDLNDLVTEYPHDFFEQELAEGIFGSLSEEGASPIPEAKKLVGYLKENKDKYNYEEYKGILNEIYRKYVLNKIKDIVVMGDKKHPWDTHSERRINQLRR